ncbi:MAG: rane protein [Pseudomonadota bacterium]|nr:rane protein [Pseudomonadota bacterium]
MPLMARIARRFGEEGFDQISASLAFTTLLSLVPKVALVLAIVSALPSFFAFIDNSDRMIANNLLPPGSAGVISAKVMQYSRRAAEVSWLGVAFLVFTAILLLNTIERAFNHVWRVREPRPVWRSIILYAVVIAVWPVLIGSLVAGVSYGVTSSLGLVGEIPWLRAKMLRVLSIGVLALFFSWLYYAVPNAAVRWRDAWIAGVAAALGFLLLQNAFELYLAYFPSYKAIYGAFATVPIFLLWVYLSWAVILLGALVAATLPEFEAKPQKRRRR